MKNEDSRPEEPTVETNASEPRSVLEPMPTPPTAQSVPTSPISGDQPQPPTHTTANSQHPTAKNYTDGFGIASIILAFVGPFQLVGFILGLVGASKAKKEGHSPTLSRVGWILNLVFGLFVILVFIGLMLAGYSGAQDQAHDTERMNDIDSIHIKLEEFYNENAYYPPEISTKTLGTSIDPEALVDPNGGGYTYVASPSGCTQCASYVVSAKLETSHTSYGQTYSKSSLFDSPELPYGDDGLGSPSKPVLPSSKL